MRQLLGYTVIDQVTGFKGIVTGQVQYLTGCNQYLVVPRIDDKGAMRDGNWLDESRLVADFASGPLRLYVPSEVQTGMNPGPDSAPDRKY